MFIFYFWVLKQMNNLYLQIAIARSAKIKNISVLIELLKDNVLVWDATEGMGTEKIWKKGDDINLKHTVCNWPNVVRLPYTAM